MVPLLLLALLCGRALAGPDEDTVDRILTAFLKNGSGPTPVDTVVYPYTLVLGDVSTGIPVTCSNGQVTVREAVRDGDVVNDGSGLAFQASFAQDFAFTYDFSSTVPMGAAKGNTSVHWTASLAFNLTDVKAKVVVNSLVLLKKGSVVVDGVPAKGARTVTMYPDDSSSFTDLLFPLLKAHLTKSLEQIVLN